MDQFLFEPKYGPYKGVFSSFYFTPDIKSIYIISEFDSLLFHHFLFIQKVFLVARE